MRWRFGRFQLDRESACFWEGEQRLTLRPKTFDLLYLVEHAGELVRKETLLEAVWPDTVVADGVLTTSMGNSGRCLGDSEAAAVHCHSAPPGVSFYCTGHSGRHPEGVSHARRVARYRGPLFPVPPTALAELALCS